MKKKLQELLKNKMVQDTVLSIGAKCIFITHYHELCETEPKIAECGKHVDYLHATINGENRVYFIQKGKAEANSYAQGIAKKYGLL